MQGSLIGDLVGDHGFVALTVLNNPSVKPLWPIWARVSFKANFIFIAHALLLNNSHLKE
jgi:hypothetical protein